MQAHGIGSGGSSATRQVSLTADEIVLFAQDARAKIASVGDELDHCHDATLAEIEEAVDQLNVGLRMLRAIERDSACPVDPDTLAVLERNRDAVTLEVAAEERVVAMYDERGVESYRERFTADMLKRMTAADLIQDVTATREQLAKGLAELAVYSGFLSRLEEES